jgi:hypothetical protein
MQASTKMILPSLHAHAFDALTAGPWAWRVQTASKCGPEEGPEQFFRSLSDPQQNSLWLSLLPLGAQQLARNSSTISQLESTIRTCANQQT